MADRTFTLSKVELNVSIISQAVGRIEAGFPVLTNPGDTPPPVLVSEVTISYRVNDLSEASIALGYSTDEGLKKLQKIFPREGEGAYFGFVDIFLKDGGPLSYDPLTKVAGKSLFSGVIVGCSHKKSGGNIAFVINCFSSIYPLTQIPVSSPGFHPTSGMSLGTVALIGNATFSGGGDLTATTAFSLLNELEGQVNPVTAAKAVVTDVLTSWKADVGSSGLNTTVRVSLEKFGLAQTKEVVQELVDTIEPVGSLGNVVLREANSSAMLGIATMMLKSNAMTFWNFFLSVFDQYGLDLLCIGDKCYVYAFNPLGDPPDRNVITATEEALVEIRDFPFDSPTRCIVIGLGMETFVGEKGSQVGEYPVGEELTSQEKATGIKTIVVQAPAFLADTVAASTSKVYNDQQTVSGLMAGVVGGGAAGAAGAAAAKAAAIQAVNSTKKQEESDERTRDQQVYSLYARYILMKQKFRQRTGMAVCRLRLDILPGFCVKIEDPLMRNGQSVATMFAYVTEVTHTISSASELAQTSMALSYVRYDGEVDDELRVNPLYQGFDPKAAAAQILSEALGL